MSDLCCVCVEGTATARHSASSLCVLTSSLLPEYGGDGEEAGWRVQSREAQHSTNELKVFVAVGKSWGGRIPTLTNHGLKIALYDMLSLKTEAD